ncbi:phosphoadenosine phosphosulfate reductase [Aeromonas enteropelogenes]|uniref:phosphoadenosine phosphosulfate reductase n=1 Tax=Aeromonas enteropelogenes TaxID=29489 RepID=UPI003B9E16C5
MKWQAIGGGRMSSKKLPLGISVYAAAKQRIEWVFDTFDAICISFSGGKDSSALLHLVASVAARKNKKFSVLFIDWEVQFNYTISFVLNVRKLYANLIDDFYWVALPLTTINGVSQIQPEWTAWEHNVKWVRQPPEFAIVDEKFFPFYTLNMTFENFVEEFGCWFSNKQNAAMLIGIRSDESIMRYQAIASRRKIRYSQDRPWTTISARKTHYKIYPIYDWKISDIWHYFSKYNLPYNKLYDLMFQAGVPLGLMRICEPFGPEQKKGLWLYKVLEPETWARVCSRVSGAVSGSIYGHTGKEYFAIKGINKPLHLRWKDYALFLLESMPPLTAEHYKNKIAIYLKWYQDRDYPIDIPDYQDNDCGSKDIPSWRRICKTILKNDYWCKMLSFSPNKTNNYKRYHERIKGLREQWKII